MILATLDTGALILVLFPVQSAEAAGIALGQTRRGRSTVSVDLMVMAFAATRGGALVYTSDVGDLQAIRDKHFPDVRVLGV